MDTTDKPSSTIQKGVLPRSLEALYRAYAFEPADTGAAFAYDDLAEWAHGSKIVMGTVWSQLRGIENHDTRLAAQEREFIEKMAVNWRLRGYGTVVPHSVAELSCRNAEQAEALRPEFRRRRVYYERQLNHLGARAVDDIVRLAPVRLDKGKGSPLWIPGTDPGGGVALHRYCRGFRDVRDLRQRLQRIAGPRPPLIQTSYIRIQSARGEQMGWRLGSPDLHLIAQMVIGRPKVRRIAAQPFAVNHWWVPYAEVLRTIMSQTPQGQHAGQIGPVITASRRWRYAAAFDLKSYDTTVAYETHVALREELWLPICHRIYHMVAPETRATLISPEQIAELDELIITMPILTPPLDDTYAAGVWPAIGQTRSGENPTSFKGTEIRRAQGHAKAKHLGFSDSDLFIYNYGDDTLLMYDNPSVADRWSETPSFLGMNEEAAPDSTFLMRRIPSGYSYLGRMLMASINREMSHEPSTALMAAAAFLTRHHLLAGHPLQNVYLAALKSYGGPPRMQRAVEMASVMATRPLAEGLQYIQQAGYSKHVVRRDDDTDIAASVSQLADSPGVSRSDRARIDAVAADLRERAAGRVHDLSWMDLDITANALPDSAVAEVISKYTYHGRSKR